MDIKACEPTTSCKVCGEAAVLYGVTDFNKNCEELRGLRLPLSGVPIYYHQCSACGLVFTEALDQWSKAAYLDHIYNDRYVDVDPDYVETRPNENARVVAEFLKPAPGVTHIDFGGGNGCLSRSLVAAGYDSSTWDPMDAAATSPAGRFGFATAFEVMEHTPLPHETVQEILQLCDEACPLILFSTYTIDHLPPRSMDFWYLAPRNGHITVHTEPSLKALFDRVDLSIHHFGNGWHLAYRTLPGWIDLQIFEKFVKRRLLHRVVIACGLNRQGRLRRGLRKLGVNA